MSPDNKTGQLSPEARRTRTDVVPVPKEVNGHQDPEPTRFGDWESKGIASDF